MPFSKPRTKPKRRPRQTVLPFLPSSPSAASLGPATTTFSPTKPTLNLIQAPRNVFSRTPPLLSSPNTGMEGPWFGLSSSDSDILSDGRWRRKKPHERMKKGKKVVGIAEGRAGLGTGFFGAAVGEREKRAGKRLKLSKVPGVEEEQGEGEEESENEDETLKAEISGRKATRKRGRRNLQGGGDTVGIMEKVLENREVGAGSESEQAVEEKRLKRKIRERRGRGRNDETDKPEPKKSKGRKRGRRPDRVVDEEDDYEPVPSVRDTIHVTTDSSFTRRGKRGKTRAATTASDDEDGGSIDVIPAKGKVRKTARRGSKREEEGGEEDLGWALVEKRRRGRHQDEGGAGDGNADVNVDDDDWNALDPDWGSQVAVKGRSRRVRVPPQRGRRKGKRPVASESQGDEDGDDDDDLPVLTPARRRPRKAFPIPSSPSDSNSDSDCPRKKPRLHRVGAPRLLASDEEDDLAADAELAAHTLVLGSRTRYGASPKKLSSFQRKLKKLRAKREGIELVSSEDEEEEAQRALYDSDNLDQEEEVGEDHEGGDDGNEPHGHGRDGGLDSDISSFIVSDSDHPLGAPDSPTHPHDTRIPIQFTSQSHASLKTHFKTVLQYILNLILNPTFPRTDEYFTFALHAVDRRVNSFRDSVLQSSAWRQDFFNALKTRPEFGFDPDGVNGWEDHCMACNRRDRHASNSVRFSGPRYNPHTLEDLPSDADSDEEMLETKDRSWPVGRYCFERAEITHSFWHWKKGLRTTLEGVLEKMGVFEDEVVRKVEKMGNEERLKWCTGELEKLEKGGDVELLWDMFSVQMRRAEEFMSRPASYFKGMR